MTTFSFNRSAILPALSWVSAAAARASSLPVLTHVLWRLDGQQLTLTASDLSVEASVSIDMPGPVCEFAMPAAKTLGIVRVLPDDATIVLSIEGSRAVIRAGRGRYVINTLAAQDFPLMSLRGRLEEISLPVPAVRALLARTAHAMAKNDVRFYLNGLLLDVAPGSVRAVATDGHRLATHAEAVDVDVSRSLLLPRDAVTRLRSWLDKSPEARLALTASESHVHVQAGHTQITVRQIDGKYPDWQRVVPATHDKTATLARADLLAALARVGLAASDRFKGVHLELSADAMALTVGGGDEEAEESIDISYAGAPLTIALGVQYLADAVAAIDSDTLALYFGRADSACRIEAADSNKTQLVIMPMRL